MNKEIFTVPQAAKYCAIGRVTLWKYVKSGELKASLTPGGHYRILKKDLEDFARKKGMYPLASYHPQMKNKILIVDDDDQIREYATQNCFVFRNTRQTRQQTGLRPGPKLWDSSRT